MTEALTSFELGIMRKKHYLIHKAKELLVLFPIRKHLAYFVV